MRRGLKPGCPADRLIVTEPPLRLYDIAQVLSGLLQRDPSESTPLRSHIALFVAVDRFSKLWPQMRRRRRNFPSASSRLQSGSEAEPCPDVRLERECIRQSLPCLGRGEYTNRRAQCVRRHSRERVPATSYRRQSRR